MIKTKCCEEVTFIYDKTQNFAKLKRIKFRKMLYKKIILENQHKIL